MLKSHALLFRDFETAWYKRWAHELKQDVKDIGKFSRLSNKFWQNAAILQTLHERGLVADGKTGIGFGVGKERLPAVLAKHKVQVVATDQDFRTTRAKHWQEDELAQELDDLNSLGICPKERFRRHVSLMSLDMRNIPDDHHDTYDFVWSNCALGHLGSIEAGLDFILASAACLKPGGFAVHTTEMNITSNSDTVTAGDTVIFRPKDIYALSKMLRKAGYTLNPLRFNLGNTPSDHRVTMRPEFGNDYSKLQINGHLATQVLLIIGRPKRQYPRLFSALSHSVAYRRAQFLQRQFISQNPFLTKARASLDHPLSPGDITPLNLTKTVTLSGKTRVLYLRFRNSSKVPLYNAKDALLGLNPILLSTNDPEDRPSKFQSPDWHGDGGNRPSIHVVVRGADGKNWQEASVVDPGQEFAFRLTLSPNKVKIGTYTEVFSVVQEGIAHLPDTRVTVTIKCT